MHSYPYAASQLASERQREVLAQARRQRVAE